MFKLKASLGAFLFALYATGDFATAGPGGSNLTSSPMDCEFYLLGGEDTVDILKWLSRAITPLKEPAQAFLGYSPKPKAFHVLGLPQPWPKGVKIKLEAPITEGEPYWLRVQSSSGKELASVAFHVPPVAVWKRARDLNQEESHLSLDLGKENPQSISVGVILGTFDHGRKFISVRRRMANLVTVSIGIDVELGAHKAYTRWEVPTLVKADSGKILSRIEVIKAHFHIRMFPHRPQTSGGWVH
jgi:hypothetical protein